MREFKGEIVVKGKVLTVKKVAPRTFTIEGFEGFFDLVIEKDGFSVKHYDSPNDVNDLDHYFIKIICELLDKGEFTNEKLIAQCSELYKK